MHITPKEIFEACLTLEPGYSYTQVEDILGLRKGALQRLFNTGAFRKLDVGYTLTSKVFDDWCVLAGIAYVPTNTVSTTSMGEMLGTGSKGIVPDYIAQVSKTLSELPISEVVAQLQLAPWQKMVDTLFSDKALNEEALKTIRRNFAGLAILANYALHDTRYPVAPQTIWESRPL